MTLARDALAAEIADKTADRSDEPVVIDRVRAAIIVRSVPDDAPASLLELRAMCQRLLDDAEAVLR